jgi:Tudor domain
MTENSYAQKVYQVTSIFDQFYNFKNFHALQIKITEIRIKRPFIKIITQNINTAKYQHLKSLIHIYSANGYAIKSKMSLGAMCIAKIGKEICRCRVLEFDNEGLVSLDFIDNGSNSCPQITYSHVSLPFAKSLFSPVLSLKLPLKIIARSLKSCTITCTTISLR